MPGPKGEPGRDGIDGMDGIGGPPGNVLIIPTNTGTKGPDTTLQVKKYSNYMTSNNVSKCETIYSKFICKFKLSTIIR